MRIADREIGAEVPPYIIAELGVNHDGSVDRALELTRAAAEAGADAVKLQLFETDRLMSKAAKLAAYQKAAGESDPITMLRRLELSIDDMARVVDLAHELKIHAIVTVFSVELVQKAETLAWDAYKSASPDIVHKPLLEALAATGKPMIVSTGASTMEEVERAVGWLHGARERLALMQCVSSYPTPMAEGEFGGVAAIRDEIGGVVGYSDHTSDERGGRFAVGYGADLLEKHVTYSRRASGPDHRASLEPREFASYCKQARRCFALMHPDVHGPKLPSAGLLSKVTKLGWVAVAPFAHGARAIDWVGSKLGGKSEPSYRRAWREATEQAESAKRKRVLPIERDVRAVSRQSIVTIRALRAGHALRCDDLTFKRPGTGLLPFRIDEVIGKTLARAVEADVPLVEEDVAWGT